MTVEQLNERFGIAGVARFEPGQGGLTKLVMTAAGGEGEVYLLGAHVTHFQPAGAEPVLWMSKASWFEVGKPIRGGVPICFPWFGMSDHVADAPNHGVVRLVEWEVESVGQVGGGDVEAVLVCRSGQWSRAMWAGSFEVRHRVRVGASLTMRLEVTNTGSEAMTFTEALHSYLAVSDVREVSIVGLEQAVYLDKMADGGRAAGSGEPIRFEAEMDRLYVDTADACVLVDPGLGREIVVSKSGSLSTVVWNPWVEKAARMPDYDDQEWPGMVCIETANTAGNAVMLAPGASHAMEARLAVRG